MYGRLNEMQYIIIYNILMEICNPRTAHSLNMVGQNAVESSTITGIFLLSYQINIIYLANRIYIFY